MRLKDQIAADIDNIFLNSEDFAEIHEVEYKQILCVFDSDDNKIGSGAGFGTYEPTFRLFAKVDDLPQQRSAGNIINIDNTDYIIENWAIDLNMAVITLKRYN